MNDLNQLHDSVWHKIDELAGEGYSVLEIAAVFSTSALTLYRTALSDKDYNKIVDSMSDMRDRVQTIQLPTMN